MLARAIFPDESGMLMEAMFGEVETLAYVIDSECRVVYFNKKMEVAFPHLETGMLCYQALRGEPASCPDCPLILDHASKSRVYNQRIRSWIETEVSDIDWPGSGACHIFLSRVIDRPDLGAADPKPFDALTGLYTREAFFSAVSTAIQAYPERSYCLMAVDIEHFKLFNEWYGEEAGDLFLEEVGRLLGEAAAESGGVSGYLSGDDFCMLLPCDEGMIETLRARITQSALHHGKGMGFLPAFGLFRIDDRSLPVGIMYDRALLALASVKGNYAQRFRWYDDGMLREIKDDHSLLLEVQQALEKGEITFYAQPKCNLDTGKIVGLEALVRWMHPERGLIPPIQFIPMLERNGLITALDLHIWEEVFRALRAWVDAGQAPVPISVNVSRRDLYALDVLGTFEGLIEKYDIPPRLLAVEITESAYVEDCELIVDIVEGFHDLGISVHMDDFGSGYSSLGMLKDVNVDVLKLDMKLLDAIDAQSRKARSILEAIIGMANLLDIRVIAEGVETESQRQLLVKMGCLYGQGYFFYKPMPKAEFEPLIANRTKVDFRGIHADSIERFRIRDLIESRVLSDAMLDDILGPLVLYDLYDGEVELLSANEHYCQLNGVNAVDLHELRSTFARRAFESDWDEVMEAFEQARENVPNGAVVVVRRMRPDGSTAHLLVHLLFLREHEGHYLYLGSLRDVTRERQQARQLESSRRALSAATDASPRDPLLVALGEENRRTALALSAELSPGGMIGGYCEPEFPLYFANAAMVELLGYDTYEELAAGIDWRVGNTIHPDDLASVALDIGPEYYVGLEYTTTYRMARKDGTWFWTLDKGRVVEAEDGRLAIVSACTDITEVMAVQQQLAERNKLLISQNEELAFLNEDMPGGYHRCLDAPGCDFLYMSDRFLDMFGYTREEIKELFDDKYMLMVHPDDRDSVAKGVTALREGTAGSDPLEYRMRAKDGWRWVIDQSRFLEYDDTSFLQGVVVDVTETVELRDMMSMLIEHTSSDIVLLSWSDKEDVRVNVVACGASKKYGLSPEQYEDIIRGQLYLPSGDGGGRLVDEIVDKIDRGESLAIVDRPRFPGHENVWMHVEARRVGLESSERIALCLVTDVTTMKNQQQELWLTKRKLEGVLDQAGVQSWDWDISSNRLVLSRSELMDRIFAGLSRFEDDMLVVDGFDPETMRFRFVPPDYQQAFRDSFRGVRTARDRQRSVFEIPFTFEDGAPVWIEVACETVRDERDRPVRAVGYYLDMTDRRNESLQNKANSEALRQLREQSFQLLKMAKTDALTGLHNRQAAIPKIEERLRAVEAGELGDASCALIMLDLDSFKLANDVFGHAYGDQVIVHVAEALKESFPGDVVCRMGGDEFLVWCEDVDEGALEDRIASALRAMEVERVEDGRTFLFSASAGYVLVPQEGFSFDDLYQKADSALFSVKMGGKRSCSRYWSGMKSVRCELAE